MEQIAAQVAQQKINEAIPAIQKASYISTYNNLVGTLSFDVTSAVSIGLENCGEIFYDSKTQKVLAQAITKAIQKQLDNAL